MIRNVGNTDKIVRLFIGIILAATGFMLAGTAIKLMLFFAAAIAFFTSAFGFCPLYKLTGINTCGRA